MYINSLFSEVSSLNLLTLSFAVRHPVVKCSHLQPGESGGDFGPVREPAEGAGFCTGGTEETVSKHRRTPSGNSHWAWYTHHSRWTHTPTAFQKLYSHRSSQRWGAAYMTEDFIVHPAASPKGSYLHLAISSKWCGLPEDHQSWKAKDLKLFLSALSRFYWKEEIHKSEEEKNGNTPECSQYTLRALNEHVIWPTIPKDSTDPLGAYCKN